MSETSKELYLSSNMNTRKTLSGEIVNEETWDLVMYVLGAREDSTIHPSTLTNWKVSNGVTLFDMKLLNNRGNLIDPTDERAPSKLLMELFEETDRVMYLPFIRHMVLRGFGSKWDRWALSGFADDLKPTLVISDAHPKGNLSNLDIV